jgi:hypothetical protein
MRTADRGIFIFVITFISHKILCRDFYGEPKVVFSYKFISMFLSCLSRFNTVYKKYTFIMYFVFPLFDALKNLIE